MLQLARHVLVVVFLLFPLTGHTVSVPIATATTLFPPLPPPLRQIAIPPPRPSSSLHLTPHPTATPSHSPSPTPSVQQSPLPPIPRYVQPCLRIRTLLTNHTALTKYDRIHVTVLTVFSTILAPTGIPSLPLAISATLLAFRSRSTGAYKELIQLGLPPHLAPVIDTLCAVMLQTATAPLSPFPTPSPTQIAPHHPHGLRRRREDSRRQRQRQLQQWGEWGEIHDHPHWTRYSNQKRRYLKAQYKRRLHRNEEDDSFIAIQYFTMHVVSIALLICSVISLIVSVIGSFLQGIFIIQMCRIGRRRWHIHKYQRKSSTKGRTEVEDIEDFPRPSGFASKWADRASKALRGVFWDDDDESTVRNEGGSNRGTEGGFDNGDIARRRPTLISETSFSYQQRQEGRKEVDLHTDGIIVSPDEGVTPVRTGRRQNRIPMSSTTGGLFVQTSTRKTSKRAMQAVADKKSNRKDKDHIHDMKAKRATKMDLKHQHRSRMRDGYSRRLRGLKASVENVEDNEQGSTRMEEIGEHGEFERRNSGDGNRSGYENVQRTDDNGGRLHRGYGGRRQTRHDFKRYSSDEAEDKRRDVQDDLVQQAPKRGKRIDPQNASSVSPPSSPTGSDGRRGDYQQEGRQLDNYNKDIVNAQTASNARLGGKNGKHRTVQSFKRQVGAGGTLSRREYGFENPDTFTAFHMRRQHTERLSGDDDDVHDFKAEGQTGEEGEEYQRDGDSFEGERTVECEEGDDSAEEENVHRFPTVKLGKGRVCADDTAQSWVRAKAERSRRGRGLEGGMEGEGERGRERVVMRRDEESGRFVRHVMKEGFGAGKDDEGEREVGRRGIGDDGKRGDGREDEISARTT